VLAGKGMEKRMEGAGAGRLGHGIRSGASKRSRGTALPRNEGLWRG
jgi:hypothetical protein